MTGEGQFYVLQLGSISIYLAEQLDAGGFSKSAVLGVDLFTKRECPSKSNIPRVDLGEH